MKLKSNPSLGPPCSFQVHWNVQVGKTCDRQHYASDAIISSISKWRRVLHTLTRRRCQWTAWPKQLNWVRLLAALFARLILNVNVVGNSTICCTQGVPGFRHPMTNVFVGSKSTVSRHQSRIAPLGNERGHGCANVPAWFEIVRPRE